MERVPFCDIDAVILSQLSYTRLAGIVGEGFGSMPVTIGEAAAIVLMEPERLKQEDDDDLWQLLGESPRFKDLILTGYVDRFDIAA